ncbi:MAG: glutamate--tRNA ligase [Planctomycetes bacterium]|nr:glutamate--tRNA ligase [Planctomycetota bacterium]
MPDPDTPVIKTRFAPSPSGHLHVGGARTALLSWAYAKGRGGRFILRIEDTDQKRSSRTAMEGMLRDLRWLGIDWDEGPEFEDCGGGDNGPYFQSERLDIYQQYLDQLIVEGKAYYAFETAEELDAKRADARQRGEPYRYDRAALDLSLEAVNQYRAEGRPAVIRLLVESGEITIHDEIVNDAIIPAGELDDFIICKADGYPTYHFAVVVDDQLMGVTHVLRAQEHFKNTAKHMLLQDALGFRRPTYGHLSVIINPDNSKMSKRDKDKALRAAARENGMTESPTALIPQDAFAAWLKNKDQQLELNQAVVLADVLGIELPEIDVDDFRRSGYLPEVLCNFLALNGWSPGQDIEKFDNAFLIERFDLNRVNKAPAKFDRAKLLSFNLDALSEMPEDDFVQRVLAHAREFHPEFAEQFTDEQLDLIARCNKARSKTLNDPISESTFLLTADEAIEYQDSKPIRKAMHKGDGHRHLAAVRGLLEALDPFTAESIEDVLTQYAQQHTDGKLGVVAQPLRIAVTGTTVSPPIYDTLALLGRQRVLARIDRCMSLRVGLPDEPIRSTEP